MRVQLWRWRSVALPSHRGAPWHNSMSVGGSVYGGVKCPRTRTDERKSKGGFVATEIWNPIRYFSILSIRPLAMDGVGDTLDTISIRR